MLKRRQLSTLGLMGALAFSLGGCAWLDEKQRKLIYRPTPGSLSDWKPVSPQDEAFWIPTPDHEGPLRAIWLPHPDPEAPAVLYLHGTLRNLNGNRNKMAAIHACGFSVLGVDYRGWGESAPIIPSEKTIVEDALRAWRALQSRINPQIPGILFGHSMGSGVAVELARQLPPPLEPGQTPVTSRMGLGPAALVLEAPFTTMPDVARDSHWLGWLAESLSTQSFRSIDKVGHLTLPVWILSGTLDRTVPPVHALRLFAAAREPKRLHRFEGGSHSLLHEEFPEAYASAWAEVRVRVLTRSIHSKAPSTKT